MFKASGPGDAKRAAAWHLISLSEKVGLFRESGCGDFVEKASVQWVLGPKSFLLYLISFTGLDKERWSLGWRLSLMIMRLRTQTTLLLLSGVIVGCVMGGRPAEGPDFNYKINNDNLLDRLRVSPAISPRCATGERLTPPRSLLRSHWYMNEAGTHD